MIGHVYITYYLAPVVLLSILTAAYRAALPNARFIDFDTTAKEEVIAMFSTMQPSDLVVLIQSSNFLLNEFRIRLHLFQQKLKVIEHTHLHRNTEEQWEVYINALAYDSRMVSKNRTGAQNKTRDNERADLSLRWRNLHHHRWTRNAKIEHW